jgi:cob(I)alamin adenosyltransferase
MWIYFIYCSVDFIYMEIIQLEFKMIKKSRKQEKLEETNVNNLRSAIDNVSTNVKQKFIKSGGSYLFTSY